MSSEFQRYRRAAAPPWQAATLVLCLLLAGCAATVSQRPARLEEPGPLPALAFYQTLGHISPAEFSRERTLLAALPPTPNTQMRLAMLIGHPRSQQDIGKAIGLLEGILKSNEPAAVNLHPLARLLVDNYGERQKQEGLLDRQGLQIKECQRKSGELQEKIDGLADIEKTLPPCSRPVRPTSPGGAK
ncbi:MAG: permease [Bacteroidota bacterium]